ADPSSAWPPSASTATRASPPPCRSGRPSGLQRAEYYGARSVGPVCPGRAQQVVGKPSRGRLGADVLGRAQSPDVIIRALLPGEMFCARVLGIRSEGQQGNRTAV